MKIIYSLTIKQRLIIGFLLCALFAIISGGIGFISLQQVQTSSRTIMNEFNHHLKKQNTQIARMMPLRSLISDIIAATDLETLKKPAQNLTQLKKQEENNPTFIISAELLKYKQQQIKTKNEIKALRKLAMTNLSEVGKLVMGIVDDVEFNAILELEDSTDNIENLATKASNAISSIKTALLINSSSKNFDIMIRDVLLANDPATVDYVANKTNDLSSQLKETLAKFSGNDSAEKLLSDLDELVLLIKTLCKKQQEVIKIKSNLDNIDRKISKQLQEIDATMVQGGQNLQTRSNHDWLAGIDLAQNWQHIQIIIVIIALVLALLVGFIISNSISQPINQGVLFAGKMADGNLTGEFEYQGKDEIGQLAQSLNQMVKNQRSMIQNIIKTTKAMVSSSQQLTTISQQMFSGAETTSHKANGVAAAAEEMNTNIGLVSAEMEQASTNVATVASGAEEMSATISEIAKNVETGKKITDQAVAQGGSTAQRIKELGQAATEIGKVTETIDAISSQTNLLALNATIEAARAGEAGKGFAVVANEIKGLAVQTATATGEIANKIKGIQDSTGATVIEINEIVRINDEVDEIVSTIATAVEEQATTTKEIAENVAQVSFGFAKVNDSVAQTTTVSATIAQDICEVDKASSKMTDFSRQVQQSAEDLSTSAAQLKSLMDQYEV